MGREDHRRWRCPSREHDPQFPRPTVTAAGVEGEDDTGVVAVAANFGASGVGAIRKTAPTKRRPEGRYEARWYDPNGVQQTRRFDTEREAKKHLALMEGDKHRGEYLDPNLARTPLRKVAEAWLATNPGRKVSTRRGYEALLKNHVLPALGSHAVGRITKATVRQFIAGLEAKGAGPGTIRNVVRNVLKPILDVAVDDQMIRTNPCVGVRLPTSHREEMLFLTPEQIADLADAITPPYGLLVTFAAYTGLRAGEIAALRVKHLDLMRGRVTVSESVAEVAGHGPVYGPTKTYAIRTLTLPRFLRDPLAAHIADRGHDPDAFVFQAPDGGPLRHGNFYGRHFKPAVRQALPPTLHGLRFHDLRHTCASLLIAMNENPKAVQAYIGHSSIQVTYDRYGHLFPGWDTDLSTKLDEIHRTNKTEAQRSAPA